MTTSRERSRHFKGVFCIFAAMMNTSSNIEVLTRGVNTGRKSIEVLTRGVNTGRRSIVNSNHLKRSL